MIRFDVPASVRVLLALSFSLGLGACAGKGNGRSEDSTKSPAPTITKSANDSDRHAQVRAYPAARPNLEPQPPKPESASEKATRRLGTAVSFVADVALPADGPRWAREAALAEVRKVDDRYRGLSVDQLKPALNNNSPNAEAISVLLRSRSQNEVITQLARFLTETNSDRAFSSATLLIADVFADPTYASSKLAEISFDLGEIARRGYYDEAIASRVALLQARLDEPAYRDKISQLTKVGLFVVGSMVTSGFVAGQELRVLDRATRSLRSIKFAELFKIPSFEKVALRRLGSMTTLERIAQSVSSRLPSQSINVVRTELGVLKLSETEINQLNLTRISSRELASTIRVPGKTTSLRWHKTNRDRLEYAFAKGYNGPLTNERLVLFKVRRKPLPDEVVMGPVLSNAKAADLYKQLKRNPKIEFLNMVDAEAEVTQTTIRADTRPELAPQPARRPFAERLGPTEPTPAYEPAAPLPTVEPHQFNWVRAGITAMSIGTLTATPSVLAYAYGDQDGRDVENMYLERQVDRHARPPETVVSDLNGK